MNKHITNTIIKKLDNELIIQTKTVFTKAVLVFFFVVIFMIMPIIQFFQIAIKLSVLEIILGAVMLLLFECIAFWIYQILAKKTNPKTILITQNELIEHSTNFPFPFWNKRVFSVLLSQIKNVDYHRLINDSNVHTYQIYLIDHQDKRIPLHLFVDKKHEATSLVKMIQNHVNVKIQE